MKIENKNINLEDMFKDLNIKLKMKQINKKVSNTGFINMYEDGHDLKKIKHVNIIKNQKEKEKDNKLDILYVYENNGFFNNNDKIKKELKMKKIVDDKNYYYINNNNNNINKKIHYSKFFSKKRDNNTNSISDSKY